MQVSPHPYLQKLPILFDRNVNTLDVYLDV